MKRAWLLLAAGGLDLTARAQFLYAASPRMVRWDTSVPGVWQYYYTSPPGVSNLAQSSTSLSNVWTGSPWLTATGHVNALPPIPISPLSRAFFRMSRLRK
ncbi:MAG: hypothetical protein KA248_12065 [Kiritimatiellae bacterium]|nr:hypothetical protein [Kiritimatiellia bacterium]